LVVFVEKKQEREKNKFGFLKTNKRIF